MRGRGRDVRTLFGLSRLAISSLGLFVALGANAQQSISAGSWTGGIRYTDAGAFDYCYISSNSPTGRSLTFVVSAANAWLLFFSNSQWKLNKDDNFDSTLSIDNAPLTSGKVLAITGDQVATGIPNEPIVFEKLRNGHAASLALPWGTFKYSLNGSTKALKAIDECRVQHAGQAAPASNGASGGAMVASAGSARGGTPEGRAYRAIGP
jgi:hypothetical protein